MNTDIKPTVLDFNDIAAIVPQLSSHERLVNKVLHWLSVDKVNAVHEKYCHTPGPEFARNLLKDFDITLRIDGKEVLDNLPEGAFVTVSNHPFGALDGISLIAMMTEYRPEFKVMVNMVLNHISAMRPNFVAVDQSASTDPEKRKVSVSGVREAISMLKEGKPVGFFPAGAIGKTDKDGINVDRPWQPVILQILQIAKVPVIPIYFHGSNSKYFSFLGHHSIPLRTANLVKELLKKADKPMKVTIGKPVSVEKQEEFGKDYEALGWYLRMQTYDLSGRHITTVSD